MFQQLRISNHLKSSGRWREGRVEHHPVAYWCTAQWVLGLDLTSSQPVGHNLHRGSISDDLHIYIVIHNSSKDTIMKQQQKIILWLGVPTTRGTVLKGCSVRKGEDHWLGIPTVSLIMLASKIS